MEKKNIIFENNGNSISMRYELLPTDQLDDSALDRMKSNRLDMVAPLQYTEVDARKVLYSQIPASVQLSAFMKKVLSKAEVLNVMKNIVTAMDIGKFSIPVSYLVKDMDYIYIDERSLRVFAFMIPIKNQTMEVSAIPDFLRSVLSHMKFRDEDKDDYVAKLLTNINSDRFSLNDFNVKISEMLLEVGDALQPAQPQMDAKVDKLGVMRNRAGQVGQPVPPMQPQVGQPVPPMRPQMGQPVPPMRPQAPVKRFDPMTGKPIGDTQVPQQPVQPQGPRVPQQPVQPQGPQVSQQPVQPQGPQVPQQPVQPQMAQPMRPQAPVKRFDPMTGKPIGDTQVPQQPVQPQGPQVPQQPVQPQMAQSVQPQGPQVPQQPVQPQDPQVPQQPVQPQGPQVPQQPVQPQMAQPVQPQGPQVPQQPVQPQGPQVPQQPVQPQKPIVPDGPAIRDKAEEKVEEKIEKKAEEKVVQPQGPILPQGPMQPEALVQTGEPEPPKGPVAPKSPEIPQVSLDDIMAVDTDDKTPKPHFVRKKTGEKIFINKEEFKIGKSRVHADYSIENNSAISRVHVIVIERNGQHYLKDNNSTNGTFVDGNKVEPGTEVLLKDNMVIKFGDEDFEYFLKEGAN